MSQRQKQRTNENRARRLGTGERTSRQRRRGAAGRGSGGVPAWAWVVAGAVLIAAVAIVAAIVLTRGGGSSSSDGRNSTVVTSRDTTAKIDWVSEGTWRPNYSHLQAALSALGLTDVAGMSGYATHYHAHISLYVDDAGKLHRVPVPQYVGIDVPDQVLA